MKKHIYINKTYENEYTFSNVKYASLDQVYNEAISLLENESYIYAYVVIKHNNSSYHLITKETEFIDFVQDVRLKKKK